jgi:hypothetical protein
MTTHTCWVMLVLEWGNPLIFINTPWTMVAILSSAVSVCIRRFFTSDADSDSVASMVQIFFARLVFVSVTTRISNHRIHQANLASWKRSNDAMYHGVGCYSALRITRLNSGLTISSFLLFNVPVRWPWLSLYHTRLLFWLLQYCLHSNNDPAQLVKFKWLTLVRSRDSGFKIHLKFFNSWRC